MATTFKKPTKATPKKPARPYSLKYTAAGTPRRYLLSGIPAGLWISFTARAKREHIAKRQVLLQLVESWTRRKGAEGSAAPRREQR